MGCWPANAPGRFGLESHTICLESNTNSCIKRRPRAQESGMAVVALVALALLGSRPATEPKTCAYDDLEAEHEAAVAFSHRPSASDIEIYLYDVDNLATPARETEIKNIIEASLKAFAPSGSDISVQWATRPVTSSGSLLCATLFKDLPDGSDYIPTSTKRGGVVYVLAPQTQARCNLNWAGIATMHGHKAATVEHPADDLYPHLLLHEIIHMVGANHASTWGSTYGDPTDAVGNRRMLRPGADISTLAAGTLAVLEWLTLIRPETTNAVPELGTTNQAVRLLPGLILSFRGVSGHDAGLQSKYQRACYLHTIATDTPQPDSEFHHSTLLAGPFTTRGVTVGNVNVKCTLRADGGATFSVRSDTQHLNYTPEPTSSFILILLWGGFTSCGILRSIYLSP